MDAVSKIDSESGEATHIKDLYAVYPVHIRRFISRFGVTTLEMTELLGLPSVQEWYRLKKHENARVRNTVVCSLLRAYTENPEWLLANRLNFKDVANRLYWLLRERGYNRRLQIIYAISQAFDKSQHILRKWYTGESDPDQASQRMIEVMMRLENDELFEFFSDARLSAISQVHGREVSIYQLESGELRYLLQGDETLYTLNEVAHKGPLPGSRRTNKDYADSSGPAHVASVDQDHVDTDMPDVIKKTKGMLSSMPWGNANG